jgi:prophage regulatory protein
MIIFRMDQKSSKLALTTRNVIFQVEFTGLSSMTHPSLPEQGFVRLSSILGPRGPLPISRSSWWAGVRAGRFPKPVKLGPRTTVWRVEDIRALIENPERARIERKEAAL